MFLNIIALTCVPTNYSTIPNSRSSTLIYFEYFSNLHGLIKDLYAYLYQTILEPQDCDFSNSILKILRILFDFSKNTIEKGE